MIDLCNSSDGENSDGSVQHHPSCCSSKPPSKRRRLLSQRQDEAKSEKSDFVTESNVAAVNTSTASAVSTSTAENESTDALVFLSNEDGSDNCIVTSGIHELLQNATDISSCAGVKQADTTATTTCSCRHPDNVQTRHQSLQLYHIQQRDKWSCGFRNLQMIQMALVPILPVQHSYYQYSNASSSGAIVEIPSLRQLQQNMETAWRVGFDPTGAQHYQHKIVGKNIWIGAVEVSNLLSFMGLDSTVVQFIKCPASRRLLLPFCRAYFSCNGNGKNEESSASTDTDCCTTHSKASSPMIARNLLQRATQRATVAPCRCSRLPLYLQWRGHSVMIVGVVNSPSSSELLVLDPLKNGTTLTRALQRHDTGPLRLDSKKLEKEDCQIVLLSTRSLSPGDRERMRKQVQSLTAAETDVMRVAERENQRF